MFYFWEILPAPHAAFFSSISYFKNIQITLYIFHLIFFIHNVESGNFLDHWIQKLKFMIFLYFTFYILLYKIYILESTKCLEYKFIVWNLYYVLHNLKWIFLKYEIHEEIMKLNFFAY